MLKRVIFIILIFISSLVFFACTPAKEPVDEPKEPIEETEEPIEEAAEGVIIKPSTKLDVANLTVLDEFQIDFDNDGELEMIRMLTAAGKDSNGDIAWDDGQRWIFLVQDSDKDYILVDEYVQLGTIDFNIFTVDEDFYISTLSPRTASLTFNLYKYDKDIDSFIMTTPYNTSGNVNMLKSSNGY